MAAKGQQFAGCTVALVTPFRDGAVDEASLRRLVDWQIEQGTPTISPVGTTGESPTLAHDEHQRVISIVVEQVAGRARVLAGTGSNATAEAVRLTRFAAQAGADGALIVSPYYNRPTQEGLYAHYARVAESCDLPIMLYNVPSRTGRNLEPETVERLARLAPVVAIKEAAGSLDQVSDILARCPGITVVSGDDSLTPPMMAVGAPASARWSPTSCRRDGDDRRLPQGRRRGARKHHARLFLLCRDLLGAGPNPGPAQGRPGPAVASDELRLLSPPTTPRPAWASLSGYGLTLRSRSYAGQA
ncbi:MAG: 4-hydroxy-tetrahydrodipicolinate synthase [Isosphaeraceae bacterium]